MAMSYRSLLPEQLYDADPDAPGEPSRPSRDGRNGGVYLLDDEVRLAVDVALATGRPLLVQGEPGSGKSSLAAYIARNLGWRYYEHVVTSRTTARDVLWTFDNVRKLADASALHGLGASGLDDVNYVEPGVLWWALDRESAVRRGRPTTDTRPTRPVVELNVEINDGRSPDHAVVLLDEIDKADPDVPNGLLVPLGSAEFAVSETGCTVRVPSDTDNWPSPRMLTILTTNDERELPPAFLRRCVTHTLAPPTAERLIAIGQRHMRASTMLAERVDTNLLEALAELVMTLRTNAARAGVRAPSTAEYLDALWACATLGVTNTHPEWDGISQLVLLKEHPAT